jgi:hypothetical protein
MTTLNRRQFIRIATAGSLALALLCRTSEFDDRTTPKQTQVLDRIVSPDKLLPL